MLPEISNYPQFSEEEEGVMQLVDQSEINGKHGQTFNCKEDIFLLLLPVVAPYLQDQDEEILDSEYDYDAYDSGLDTDEEVSLADCGTAYCEKFHEYLDGQREKLTQYCALHPN